VDHRSRLPIEIVETGIYSGVHGVYCSTRIFGQLCRDLNGRVRTVDIDAKRVQAALALLGDLEPWVEPAADDSVRWLKQLDGRIDFLHLDSWDYNGERLNRWRSRWHCLREIRAALPKLAADAVVLIDDQNMDRAWWTGADYRPGEKGKGALAVPWLLRRGWRVLAEEYQVALVRNRS
jgi:predicted O-methyltransferase YrrM